MAHDGIAMMSTRSKVSRHRCMGCRGKKSAPVSGPALLTMGGRARYRQLCPPSLSRFPRCSLFRRGKNGSGAFNTATTVDRRAPDPAQVYTMGVRVPEPARALITFSIAHYDERIER